MSSKLSEVLNAVIDKAEYVVESKSLGTVTVGASTFASINGDVAKTGYTPIGIVGIAKSGEHNGDIAITAFRVSETTATVALRNHTSTARTIGVTVSVLYHKG